VNFVLFGQSGKAYCGGCAQWSPGRIFRRTCGRPHWHSGPNQPLCGPITLPQSGQFLRSGGVGGIGILPL